MNTKEWREKNREKLNAYWREYRKTHASLTSDISKRYRERHREEREAYRLANIERKAEYDKQRYTLMKDEIALTRREYYEKTGRTRYHNIKAAYRIIDIRRRLERRIWFDDIKKKHFCSRCGEGDYRCLQFHHINGRKTDTVSKLVGMALSKDTILAEIAKCIVVCANCHSKIHYVSKSTVQPTAYSANRGHSDDSHANV